MDVKLVSERREGHCLYDLLEKKFTKKEIVEIVRKHNSNPLRAKDFGLTPSSYNRLRFYLYMYKKNVYKAGHRFLEAVYLGEYLNSIDRFCNKDFTLNNKDIEITVDSTKVIYTFDKIMKLFHEYETVQGVMSAIGFSDGTIKALLYKKLENVPIKDFYYLQIRKVIFYCNYLYNLDSNDIEHTLKIEDFI